MPYISETKDFQIACAGFNKKFNDFIQIECIQHSLHENHKDTELYVFNVHKEDLYEALIEEVNNE